jgi:hypothetical protein
LPKATPAELISFLLEQRGQSAKDLWPVFGSKGNTSEILRGKRAIGIAPVSKLGRFFNVPPQTVYRVESFLTLLNIALGQPPQRLHSRRLETGKIALHDLEKFFFQDLRSGESSP